MSAPRPPRAPRLRRGTALALLVVLPGLAVMAVGDDARDEPVRAGAAAGGSLAHDAATATLPAAPAASVPATAVTTPASVSSVRERTPTTAQVVATASASAVPSTALAAYQRAETVINAADPGCHLTWQMIAAIGRVESDHGRYGGNRLDAEGVARPGIFGPALDGSNGTRRIADTDAGQYDGDQRLDRAVGPLQFIPSTWSAIGVDADGDGVRDPQDVDDAALGAAVYLCSGDDDLSTEVGQRAAAYRYNNSAAYVDLVLQVMDSYLAGDFEASPTPSTTSAAGVSVLPSGPSMAPRVPAPRVRSLSARTHARRPAGGGTDRPREDREAPVLVGVAVPGGPGGPARPDGDRPGHGPQDGPAAEPFEPGAPAVDGGPVTGGPSTGGPVVGAPQPPAPEPTPDPAPQPTPQPPVAPAPPPQPDPTPDPAPDPMPQPPAPPAPPAAETCTEEAAMAALGVTDAEELAALLALDEAAREAELTELAALDPEAATCVRGLVEAQLA